MKYTKMEFESYNLNKLFWESAWDERSMVKKGQTLYQKGKRNDKTKNARSTTETLPLEAHGWK